MSIGSVLLLFYDLPFSFDDGNEGKCCQMNYINCGLVINMIRCCCEVFWYCFGSDGCSHAH